MRRACLAFFAGVNLVRGRKLSSSQLRLSKQQRRDSKDNDGESRWVYRFCAAPGHEFYSEIPMSFIRDPVTTATVCDSIESPYVKYAIKILNGENDNQAGLYSKSKANAIDIVTEELYNLLHGRYVLTDDGLKSVRAKYDAGVYGKCLRVFCHGHHLLPIGLHDHLGESTVKCFCPKCRDIYNPQMLRNRSADGAAFGTSLPHLLLQRMPELATTRPTDSYVPRLFGFRIHESAPELQIYNELTPPSNTADIVP